MERTATSIIEAATAKNNATILGSSSRGDDLHIENMIIPTDSARALPPTVLKVTKKRGRPEKKVAASPKIFAGSGSSRILLSQYQASPAGARTRAPPPRSQ